jgi:hypothetical protein
MPSTIFVWGLGGTSSRAFFWACGLAMALFSYQVPLATLSLSILIMLYLLYVG